MASSTSTPTHTPIGETTQDGMMQQELLQKLLTSNDVVIPPHGITDPFSLRSEHENVLVFHLDDDRYGHRTMWRRLTQAPFHECIFQCCLLDSIDRQRWCYATDILDDEESSDFAEGFQ